MPKGSLRRFSKFLIELSRRRVIRAVGVYIVLIWLLSQGVADLFPAFGLPDWTVRYFVLAGLLAIPLVALISWYFDLTPEGIVRDPRDGTARRDPSDSGERSLLATWKDHEGSAESARFSHEALIGRGLDTDIRLRDKRVSREHARLYLKDDQWWVKDLGSANGTFIDGEQISDCQLDPECELRFHRQGPRVLIELDALEDTAVSRSGVTGQAASDTNTNDPG